MSTLAACAPGSLVDIERQQPLTSVSGFEQPFQPAAVQRERSNCRGLKKPGWQWGKPLWLNHRR